MPPEKASLPAGPLEAFGGAGDDLVLDAERQAEVAGAAETGTGQSMYEIEKYTAVNIGGTSLMLDLLTNTRHSVEKVIVAASRAIYGEGRYLSEEMGYVYPLSRADEDMRRGDFECK